jgi:5'-3' exonuclease
MVYHCLRRPGAKPYEGEETRLAWEDHLIADVCKYLKKIVSLVNPTEQVFVGVDGVVPMAKMRQQRLRRFKSHWTAAEEKRIGKSEGGPRWDTNAITPGTAFMERLGNALKGCGSGSGGGAKGVKWLISTADEPGEGEHKAMIRLRSVVQEYKSTSKKQSHVVYGLDADLIVLSLLQEVDELWLFREAVECGEVQYNDSNEEEYAYFSIHKLRELLTEGKDKGEGYLLDYCMAMSFLGNDFLPHGMSLKLKDGGHDILLEMLKQVRKNAGPLIYNQGVDGKSKWNKEALKACIEWLSEKEEEWIHRHCQMKIGSRFQHARGATPLEQAIDEWNKTPLRISEEMALVRSIQKDENQKTRVELLDTWRDVYNERWLGSTDVDHICTEYIRGLDWILQYYTGAHVNTEWCFPWFLPPLWRDLKDVLDKVGSPLPIAPKPTDIQIKPQEQLALVMPLASWWLIRDPALKGLPKLAPQLWPSSFELFTAGHTQIWECEAQIPLFMPKRLRYLIDQPRL